VYRSLLAGLLALALAPASAAPLATLIITVEKVSSRGGDLRVALYDRRNYPVDNGATVADTVVPAKPGETIVTLSGIKPGEYAVKMFEDYNRNGKFDMNWLGWPLEKFGFSNDVHPTFTEPPFDATKFELRPGTNTITIHLQ
jgi:uncharacterized protein (DUF2141 family)